MMASNSLFPQPTQFGHDILLKEANRTFDDSRTQGLEDRHESLRSTNAPLDPKTLSPLLEHEFGPEIQISALRTTLNSRMCQTLYGVDKSTDIDRNKRVFIEFTQCANTLAAETDMKNYLSLFERTPSEVTRRAGIGLYSLRTDNSVFWVRDTIFAKISAQDVSGECPFFEEHFLSNPWIR
jgi:hypothetical protein